MVKFIHCSDLHLDTPFKGLTRRDPAHAERQRKATTESFSRIIDLCIERNADFLIIAGDIYDSANRSVATQIGFAKELRRLDDRGVHVFIACGNHDPLSDWLPAAKLPENTCRFVSDRVERVRLERDGQVLADVYGISFGEERVTENLASHFTLANEPAPVSIAVLHGTVGAAGPHEHYSPFRVEDVETKGFDYWALGHIHKRNIVREAFPAIVYPGNPQGRDFGETGPKGCVYVEIEPGVAPSVEFIPTQTIRFEDVTVNISGEEDYERLGSLAEELPRRVADYDPESGYVFRIRLEGRTPLDPDLRREGEAEALADQMNASAAGVAGAAYVDSIEIRTRPDIDLDAIRAAGDFPAEVLKLSDALRSDPEELHALFEEVGAEFRYGAARREIGSLGGERMKEILEESTMKLLGRLVEDAE